MLTNIIISLMTQKYSEKITSALLFLNFLLSIITFGIMRPVRTSLIVSSIGAKNLPYLWLGTTLSCIIFVLIYTKCLELFNKKAVIISTLALFGLSLLGIKSNLSSYPNLGASLTYIWADVQVIVAIELFWSLAVDEFNTINAKKLFGAMNSGAILGAIVGSIIASHFSHTIGTTNLISLTSVICFVNVATCIWLFHYLRPDVLSKLQPKTETNTGFLSGFRMIFKQKYLTLILLSVFCSQLISNLIDFQFNILYEKLFTDVDARTHSLANFFIIMNSAALVISLSMPFIYKILGPLKSFFILPIGNFITMLFALIFPDKTSLLFLKGYDKAINYSVDILAKQILYVPVDPEVKYKAKAVIDMFVYRFGSAGGSIVVLLLSQSKSDLISYGVLFSIVSLFVIRLLLAKEFKLKV